MLGSGVGSWPWRQPSVRSFCAGQGTARGCRRCLVPASGHGPGASRACARSALVRVLPYGSLRQPGQSSLASNCCSCRYGLGEPSRACRMGRCVNRGNPAWPRTAVHAGTGWGNPPELAVTTRWQNDEEPRSKSSATSRSSWKPLRRGIRSPPAGRTTKNRDRNRPRPQGAAGSPCDGESDHHAAVDSQAVGNRTDRSRSPHRVRTAVAAGILLLQLTRKRLGTGLIEAVLHIVSELQWPRGSCCCSPHRPAGPTGTAAAAAADAITRG